MPFPRWYRGHFSDTSTASSNPINQAVSKLFLAPSKDSQELSFSSIIVLVSDDSSPQSQTGCLKQAGSSPGKEVIVMATRKIGRSAVTGKFMPVNKAKGKPNAVVETIKTPKKGK
jgi:hypothetical protein